MEQVRDQILILINLIMGKCETIYTSIQWPTITSDGCGSGEEVGSYVHPQSNWYGCRCLVVHACLRRQHFWAILWISAWASSLWVLSIAPLFSRVVWYRKIIQTLDVAPSQHASLPVNDCAQLSRVRKESSHVSFPRACRHWWGLATL